MSLKLRFANLVSGESALRSRLVAAAGGTLALHVSTKLLALLASILLARTLGADGYGVYASALALLLRLVIPAQLDSRYGLGMDHAW